MEGVPRQPVPRGEHGKKVGHIELSHHKVRKTKHANMVLIVKQNKGGVPLTVPSGMGRLLGVLHGQVEVVPTDNAQMLGNSISRHQYFLVMGNRTCLRLRL